MSALGRFGDQIATYLEAVTEPRGVSFAVVMWVDGKQDLTTAVCVVTTPRCGDQAAEALETALLVAP